MTEPVKHKCEMCGEWKPAPDPGTSYFTEFRGWFCDDCKYERAVNSGRLAMPTVKKELENR